MLHAVSLTHLKALLSLAEKHQLMVMPTVLVGHMSGVNWLPDWTMSDQKNDTPLVYAFNRQVTEFKPRNLFTDLLIVKAQEMFIQTIITEIKQYNCIWAWDITNEINQAYWTDDSEATSWQNHMIQAVKSVDTVRPVTTGVHTKLQRENGFPLQTLAANDAISLHVYPMYEGKDALDLQHVEQTIKSVQSLGKPVILSEFGVPTTINNQRDIIPISWVGRVWSQPLVTEAEQANYTMRVISLAQQTGCAAAFIWCWSDFYPILSTQLPFSRLPHERTFGLVNADGRPKVVVQALAQLCL